MKLSRKNWWLITAGVFSIALAGLGLAYPQQVSQENGLNKKLALARSSLEQVQLEKFSSQKTELERQVSEATSQCDVVKAMLPKPAAGSIPAITTVFELAKINGVEVAQVSSARAGSEKLEGITFSVISITTKVNGDLPHLVGFISVLNSSLATGVIRSVTMTIPTNTSAEKASADIQLVVYIHQGG